jgi:hypothetical protein
MPPIGSSVNVDRNGARRLTVQDSPIHGRGVFAAAGFDHDEFVVDFRGRVVTWSQAQPRHNTYLFDLGGGRVVDGAHGGNESRWINHGCDPNCIAFNECGQVAIYALRSIDRGEELLLDYRLVVDAEAPRDDYVCRCGSALCRGTMLAP